MAMMLGVGSSISSFAQVQSYTLSGMTAAGTVKARDTTTNPDTTYLVMTTNGDGSITYPGDLVYNWTNTNISGTTGGSVIYQGSMTGTFAVATGWTTLVNDKTGALVTDTVTVSGTTKGTLIIKNNTWKYVRARYISSGTQTSVMTGTAYFYRRS